VESWDKRIPLLDQVQSIFRQRKKTDQTSDRYVEKNHNTGKGVLIVFAAATLLAAAAKLIFRF